MVGGICAGVGGATGGSGCVSACVFPAFGLAAFPGLRTAGFLASGDAFAVCADALSASESDNNAAIPMRAISRFYPHPAERGELARFTSERRTFGYITIASSHRLWRRNMRFFGKTVVLTCVRLV